MSFIEWLCDLIGCRREDVQNYVNFTRFPDYFVNGAKLLDGTTTELLAPQAGIRYYVKCVSLDMQTTDGNYGNLSVKGFYESSGTTSEPIAIIGSWVAGMYHRTVYPGVLVKSGSKLEIFGSVNVNGQIRVIYKMIPDTYLGRIE